MLTKDCVRFLKGLEKNNSKEWFDLHREEYEAAVKKPFKILIEELIDQAAQIEPGYDCTASQAIFRINRDVRFSANKAPYKTNIAAAIGPNGRKSVPGFYIHLDAKKTLLGGGAYELDKEQLESVRDYLMQNPTAMPEAVKNKNFSKTYGEILGEKNKILPPLYKDAAAANSYLYNKQFYYMREMSTEDFIKHPNQVQLMLAHLLAASSVNTVLRAALA